MIINDVEINSDIELLTPQSHENVAIIPLKSQRSYVDLLTLKKGLNLGLVEVKECETSTVNTLIVKNNSITPLILIDGEEVVGGDQNRLVNATTIIAPNSQSKISVSCTERGRWEYRNEFKNSEYIANFNTRRAKMFASIGNMPVQNAVWSSIDHLENAREFTSATSAMSESYDNAKVDLEEMVDSFKVVDGQTGVLIIINGEIKGFELFLNSEIYREFHEKILKSYLIDAKVENTTFTINTDEAKVVIENALDSGFEEKISLGLEQGYEFETKEGLGKIYIYKEEIVHFSYFKKLNDEESINNMDENVHQKYSIRD